MIKLCFLAKYFHGQLQIASTSTSTTSSTVLAAHTLTCRYSSNETITDAK